jgi:internalin A
MIQEHDDKVPMLRTKAKVKAYFDRGKYHLRFDFETLLHRTIYHDEHGQKSADKLAEWKPDRKFVINDGVTASVVTISDRIHPSGCMVETYAPREALPLGDFPWSDPARLGTTCLNIEALIRNLGRDSISVTKSADGILHGSFRIKNSPKVRVEFDADPAVGFNVVARRIFNPDEQLPASSTELKWRKIGDVWFAEQIVEVNHYKDANNIGHMVRDTFSYDSVELNKDVDPALFTLDSTGYPGGAQFYDRKPAPAKAAELNAEPLPAEVVSAWRQAGADVRWIGLNKDGEWEFHPSAKGNQGDLPVFMFGLGEWTTGVIGQLPQPQRAFGLSLQRTPVTDTDLKDLVGLKNLSWLDLNGARISDAGLKHLAGLTDLSMLDLASTRVTDAGLKELAGLKNLQTLKLSGNKAVSDVGLKELADLKSLQYLGLISTQVTDAGLKNLHGFQRLRSLYVGGTRVTDVGLRELAELKALQTLHLSGTQVTDSGLKELAGLKSLQTLNLAATKVTDSGLKELAALKSLRSLYLDATQVTDAGLKELAALPNLQILHLDTLHVTDAGLRELAGLRSLEALFLGRTQVTDAGLKQLAGLKDLQKLGLNGTNVTDAGLKELGGLTSLQRLNLMQTHVTDAGVKDLQKKIPNCQIVCRFPR